MTSTQMAEITSVPANGHHLCHNPNCRKPISPALVVHRKAWFQVPRGLRSTIWRYYREGQEKSKRPSPEYLEALHDVINYLTNHNIKCGVV